MQKNKFNLYFLIVVLVLFAVVNVSGQDAGNRNTADNSLKGSGRVNGSTLAMEFSLPLASYKGRGIDVPISISYSSKLWRSELVAIRSRLGYSSPCYSYYEMKYAEDSESGWTSSVDAPRIEYTGASTGFDGGTGKPFPQVQVDGNCGDESPDFQDHVRRITVRLPSGETHELRADDSLIGLSRSSGASFRYNQANWNGTFYAVDGSNIKYVQSTGSNLYELQMPDGSKYNFSSSSGFSNGVYVRNASSYTDRNSNQTTYQTGYIQDTLGRSLYDPIVKPSSPTPSASPQIYTVPGMEGEYKFHWKRLKGDSAGESGLTDFNVTLKPIGEWYRCPYGVYYVECSQSALFETETPLYSVKTWNGYDQTLFNPIVLTEIELPTGESYSFSYNGLGLIEQIHYPTGGEEHFTYNQIPTLGMLDPDDVIGGATNFGVAQRNLYENENADPYTWTYQAAYVAPSGYVIRTVNPDGTKGENFLHQAKAACGTCSSGDFGYDDPLAGMPYETRSYDSDDRIVSRTFTHWSVNYLSVGSWGAIAGWHPRVTYQETITYDPAANGNAVSSIVKNEYQGDLSYRDTPLLLNKTTQYAFAGLTSASMPSPGATPSASPTPIPTPSPSTSPVKIVEYLHLINDSNYSGVKSNYTDQNIVGLVTESVIKDGAGTVVSKSINVFDESGKSPGYRGNPTTLKVWDSTKGAYTSSGNYISTTAEFDTYGNQVEATDARGCTTTTTFDTTYHTYPETVTSCTPSDGTYGSSSSFVTTATFNTTTGLPLTTTDANGLITAITYDTDTLRPLNTKTYQTSVSSGNQVGATVETEYHDEPGNYWVKNRSQIDTGIWAESITYFDGLGRAWKSEEVNSKGNIFVEKEFDAEGRVKRVSNPFRAGETKVWTTNTYDDASRLIEVELQDGSTITTDYAVSTSAPIGITKQITDQAGKKRKGITDVLGRMVRVIEDPSGTPLNTDYVFDTLGNLRKTTQGDQNRYFMHDSLGRLLFAKQPEQETRGAFSATDPITSNTAWSVKYEYDDNGNITKTTDARGVYIEGAYDAFNRLKTRNYSDSTPDVTFYYDGKYLDENDDVQTATGAVKGKTTFVNSSVSRTNYTSFDILGRLLAHQQITDGKMYDTEYSYNLSGGLVSEKYPSDRVIHHDVDENGDLERVWGDDAGTISTYANAFNYNVSGAIEKMRLGNGRWETAQYNTRQQITKIGLGMGSNSQDLLKLEFGYGDNTENNGNLRTQTITVPTAGGTSGFTATQTYAYDNLNRLLSATETIASTQTWKQTFTMDRYGNRRYDTGSTTTLGSCTEAVCNPTVSTSTNRFTSSGWDYDEAGNVLEDGAGYQFAYDAENHQIEVKNDVNATVGEYFYDGEGRRVKKIAGAETTVFVYNASGQLVAEYSTQTSGTPQISYLTTDHLGSTRLVTDQLGAVKDRKDHSAFGDETVTAARVSALGYTTAEPTRKGYTGYEKDGESGLEFAQARYYSTTHGRYTSVDPLTASASIKNPQTFNRYTYVLNSPYKYADPLGLIPVEAVPGVEYAGDGGIFNSKRGWHSGWMNGWEQAAAKAAAAKAAQASPPAPPENPAAEQNSEATVAQNEDALPPQNGPLDVKGGSLQLGKVKVSSGSSVDGNSVTIILDTTVLPADQVAQIFDDKAMMLVNLDINVGDRNAEVLGTTFASDTEVAKLGSPDGSKKGKVTINTRPDGNTSSARAGNDLQQNLQVLYYGGVKVTQGISGTQATFAVRMQDKDRNGVASARVTLISKNEKLIGLSRQTFKVAIRVVW